MEKKADAPTREERLAAKLRENLKRRKAQARELGDQGTGPGNEPDDTEANAPLPKEPTKS